VRITVLASGSSGNAILVEAESTRLLIDCGLHAKSLAQRFEKTSLPTRLDQVQGVLVTHEHGDHANCAAALASAGLTLWTTAGTARAARLAGTTTIAAGEPITIGAIEVTPIAVPHDAAEPVGFVLRSAHGSVGVFTDIGRPTALIAEAAAACDVLVLEANHDVDLLRNAVYPPTLKRRIGSDEGHLSNEQACELVANLERPRTQVLVLAHLSEETNRPRLARLAMERTLRALGRKAQLLVADQTRPLGPVEVDKHGRARQLAGADNRQLRMVFPE
jgi:phosphoribosyl 1,2-cyclic phosphodiesterase